MIRLLLLLMICMVPLSARADDFGSIPVLHDGRIKPLDSFARIHLKLFSGSERIDGMNAQNWLMQTMFNPPEAFDRPVFKVGDPDVQELLKLPKRRGHLYSLADISPALEAARPVIETLLERDDSELSRAQKALLTLQVNRILYSDIMRSLSLIVPLAIDPPESLSLPEQESYTALDFQRIAKQGESKLKDIIRKKGNNIDSYREEELQLAQFMMRISVLQEVSSTNMLLRIIPPQWNDSEEWMSPSTLIQSGQGSPQSAAYLDLWREAAIAYNKQDKQALSDTFSTIYDSALTMLPGSYSGAQLKAELLYNTVHPYHAALFFFALAIAVIFLYAVNPMYLFYYGAIAAITIALGFTGLGMVIRMFVLERPPVGTLYESILFVSFIIPSLSLIAERVYKNALSLFAGTLSAFILIAISGGMEINPDDKQVLVAVLDTKFWLATHVLIITGGYGLCIITCMAAHIHLGLEALNKNPKTLHKNMTQAIYFGALLSLLFMAVGTILGGVWADQSWGRFWGWDPKENGALLIVLWLAWIIHGKLSGHLRAWDVTALYAYLGVVVALSWFGVNLLSIGLHSYGFIDGIAYGLLSFIALETCFIGGTYCLIRQREKACAQT